MSNVIIDSTLLAIGVVTSAAMANVSPDASAFAGSVVAAVIALNDARSTQKDRFTLACVVLSSIVVGMLLPGGIMFNFYPVVAARLTFHIWALMGLAAGLIGWALVLFVIACKNWLLQRKDKLASRVGQRFLGGEDETK